MRCSCSLAVFGAAFAVLGTVAISSDAFADPASLEDLIARATNYKRIPDERRRPAAEALARLSEALPDPEAAKRVVGNDIPALVPVTVLDKQLAQRERLAVVEEVHAATGRRH